MGENRVQLLLVSFFGQLPNPLLFLWAAAKTKVVVRPTFTRGIWTTVWFWMPLPFRPINMNNRPVGNTTRVNHLKTPIRGNSLEDKKKKKNAKKVWQVLFIRYATFPDPSMLYHYQDSSASMSVNWWSEWNPLENSFSTSIWFNRHVKLIIARSTNLDTNIKQVQSIPR